MKGVPRSLGATPWLAATVAILLPTLAWLQYDWVNQLATADRERRERTLRAAGAQFTNAVDAEISRLGGGLQLDGAMVERRDWDAYALRYDAAIDGGTSVLEPQVWFAEIDESAKTPEARIALRHWNPTNRAFEPVDWPGDLQALHTQLLAVPPHEAPGERRGPREMFAAMNGVGDERTLVMPILRVETPRTPGATPDRFVTDVRMRGYTIVRLDVDALARERLPQLASEHFPEAAEYRVAVVANADNRVIYESSPGAAADTATDPDLSTTFLQPRLGPMMIFARVGANGAAPPEPRIDRLPPPDLDGGPGDRSIVSMVEVRERDGQRTVRTRSMQGRGRGHWTLRVKHAAGSLEAAVAAARRRNLMVSGGTLALLGVVVALIAVSARRAQGLARQHMEFVAAVSHELRTPVAVINSAAGNLADGVVAEPGRVKKYGETIQGEARRLGETVERVLQLAGLGSGRPLPMAPLAVHTLVHDAVARLSPEAARAGIDVQVQLTPELPPIVGDAGMLLSAVQNLVGNAIKYAGQDRWVRVTASSVAGSRPEVRIAVEDHGAGLGADERRKVFEPFFRGRDAVANQVQGSGLGLSLVQRIADAHGGRVELVSEPSRGSTFTICLPAAPDLPATAAAPGTTATAPSAS